jgi:hypothetical protein
MVAVRISAASPAARGCGVGANAGAASSYGHRPAS